MARELQFGHCCNILGPQTFILLSTAPANNSSIIKVPNIRSDLTLDVTSSMVRTKRAGMKGLLVAHRKLSRGRTLHQRGIYLNSSPIRRDRFLGGVFEVLEELSWWMLLKAFLTSSFSNTFSLCDFSSFYTWAATLKQSTLQFDPTNKYFLDWEIPKHQVITVWWKNK